MSGFGKKLYIDKFLLVKTYFLVAVWFCVLPDTFSSEAEKDKDRLKIKDLEAELDSMNLDSDEFKFMQFCDYARLYIDVFPFSERSQDYLKKLENISDKLSKKANQTYAAFDKSKESAFYLGSFCMLFPNSEKAINYFDRAVRSAEFAKLPVLEIELRSRRLIASDAPESFRTVKDLAKKAFKENYPLIALNCLHSFHDAEFQLAEYKNLNLGPSLILSGDIYRYSGIYDRAIAKYTEAIRWSGEMKLNRTSRAEDSSPKASEQDIVFSDGSDISTIKLVPDDDPFSDNGLAKIEEVILQGGIIPGLLDFEIATIEKNANILIGRALIEDARSKQRSQSTAGFAGKLYEKAVNHFEKLLKPLSVNDYSSTLYKLGFLRASVELARYKRLHQVSSGDAFVNEYARCVPFAEAYLRLSLRAQDKKENLGYEEWLALDRAGEVAFMLMESFFALGNDEAALVAYAQYFSRFKSEDKWRVMALCLVSDSLVQERDYLGAYPLLDEVVSISEKAGLHDLAFTAGLMKGICVRRLGSSTEFESENGVGGGDRFGKIKSPSDLARSEYKKAASSLTGKNQTKAESYPSFLRKVFINEIRSEISREFGRDEKGGELVAVLQEMDKTQIPFENWVGIPHDKPFRGFSVNIMTGAKVGAQRDSVATLIDESARLTWNPFEEGVQ